MSSSAAAALPRTCSGFLQPGITQLTAGCFNTQARDHRKQHAFKKAGVMLHDLVKREAAQPGLFDQRDHASSHRLMSVIDKVNQEHGSGKLRLASASPFTLLPCRTWHRRSDNCSPRYTTRWAELPCARATKSQV